MSNVHIHAPEGYYLGQIKRKWGNRWMTVTQNLTDPKTAMAIAVLRMEPEKHIFARVIFCAEWYDPNVVMTARFS
jgi:hypothetical protein